MLIRDHRIGFSSNVFFILKSLQRKKITLRNELLWDTESIVEQYSLPCDRCVTLGQYKLTSLRKLLTFRGTTNGFPAKWLLRNKAGEIPYWWCHYPDLASVLYWQCRERNLLQPIRSTIQIWVVKRHQYGISALVPQTLFRGETSGDVVNVDYFLRLQKTVLDLPLPFYSKLEAFIVRPIKSNGHNIRANELHYQQS